MVIESNNKNKRQDLKHYKHIANNPQWEINTKIIAKVGNNSYKPIENNSQVGKSQLSTSCLIESKPMRN